MEDNFDESQEDNLWWKTISEGRRLSMEGNFVWNACLAQEHSLSACNATPPVKFNMADIGLQSGKWGLKEESNPRLLDTPNNFCQIAYLTRALLH